MKDYSNPYNNYDINGYVTIRCNRKDYYPEYFLTKDNITNPDIVLTTSAATPPITNEFKQIATDLHYSKKQDQILSEVTLLRYKGTLSIKNLTGQPTEVHVNNRYRQLSRTLLKVPISTAFPDKAFAQMILHVKLLIKNHTFLVGSCFQPENHESAVLISSIGGMGKTTTVFKALNEFGGKYLADDMTIINEAGKVYAYPKPARIRKTHNFPINIESYKNPQQILSTKNIIANSSQIGTILLLERGTKNELTPITPQEAAKKLLIITRKLLPYYMERTLLGYAYANPAYDLPSLMQTEERIISKNTEKARSYILTSKIGNPDAIIEMMRSIL